jgi:arginase
VTVAVVSAPTALGLSPGRTGRPRGTWRAPTAYRALGVVERLGAVDAGVVEPPPYRPERDPRTGLRNAPELAVHIAALAERIGGERDAGRWPLVLGGDCSVLAGASWRSAAAAASVSCSSTATSTSVTRATAGGCPPWRARTSPS